MKKFWCCALLLMMAPVTFASQAIDYANRMGGLAGIVDGCGGNAGLLNSRVNEVIRLMSHDVNEVYEAQKSYELAYRANFDLQVGIKQVSCDQALKTYANLPLLQNDYQTAVLAKIKKSPQTPRTSQYPPPNPAAKPNTSSDNPKSTPNYPYY